MRLSSSHGKPGWLKLFVVNPGGLVRPMVNPGRHVRPTVNSGRLGRQENQLRETGATQSAAFIPSSDGVFRPLCQGVCQLPGKF